MRGQTKGDGPPPFAWRLQQCPQEIPTTKGAFRPAVRVARRHCINEDTRQDQSRIDLSADPDLKGPLLLKFALHKGTTLDKLKIERKYDTDDLLKISDKYE